MKTKKYFFAAIFFGLISSMIWTSCEKSTDFIATPVQEPTLSSDLISDYVTEKDIEKLRADVAAFAPPQAGMELLPIVIRMKNQVYYNAADKMSKSDSELSRLAYESHESIFFTGHGSWNDVGSISYREKVSLPFGPGVDHWTGKGSITVDRMLDATVIPRKNKLTFLSGFRYESSPKPDIRNEEFAEPEKVVESRLQFTGGQGIFSNARGRAKKVEFYFGDDSQCLSYIYGFVLVKTRVGVEDEIQEIE